MLYNCLYDLIANGIDRREGTNRLLKDQRNFTTSNLPNLASFWIQLRYFDDFTRENMFMETKANTSINGRALLEVKNLKVSFKTDEGTGGKTQ
ncbi:hypothetical protein ES703_64134 [subsurface metagenome]